MNFITHVDLVRAGKSCRETVVELLIYSKVRILLITVVYIVSMQFQPVVMITVLSRQYGCHNNETPRVILCCISFVILAFDR